MIYVALSAAYIIWIGKGSFPLRDCTKLQITVNGYENKMNATECFNSTFLAPFTEQPQYLGVMAIIIFVLWFFVPIMLLYLQKSLKASLIILSPMIIVIGIGLCTFVSSTQNLTALLDSEYWSALGQPGIWHSAMVQALLSSHIVSGYLVSSGGTLYKYSDVRWTSTFVIITNFLSGWVWVFLWQSINTGSDSDRSFIAILVLIYQSSVAEKRPKQWPLLAFGVVFASGIITLLTLLYPVYHKLNRIAGDNWRTFAAATSALGTAVTVAILAQGLNAAAILDDLVLPVLAVFTTVVEVVGFVFIYGLFYLSVDIEFITGTHLPWFWLMMWWLTPILLMGVSGWWLRSLLRATWGNGQTLWPLGGVLIGILVIMIILAGIAVAKEEQFNLFSKIKSAFRPSRLWGPEEPMSRYIWMSQRSLNENSEYDYDVDTTAFNNIINKYNVKNNEIKHDGWSPNQDIYQSAKNKKNYDIIKRKENIYSDNEAIYSIPVNFEKGKNPMDIYNSICISKEEIGGPICCECNRHFQLKVPDLRNNEISTSL
ncbi:sodium-dependent nutrient amino acid transporter 1-like isoform X2 [Aricia agestis]|nr:sodium-dependent nutrient amino acid transporter 1-like isoform X2 [Aricia agestis]